MGAHKLKTDPSDEKIMSVLNSLAKAEDLIIKRLTTTAWNMAYTALWNGTQFSAREKQKAKQLIQEFLLSTEEIEKNYEEFAQRVLLTRQYLANNPSKFLPHPSEWLSKENKMGFAGTHRWFLKLAEKQKAMPQYKAVWKEIAWALFSINGKAASRNFHEWRSYLAQHNQPLLNLFLSTVANQCHWLAYEAQPLTVA